MIITALNYNKYYIEQLMVLLVSLSINSPTDEAHVYLVNFPNGEMYKLKEEFPQHTFYPDTIKNLTEENAAGYMVCYRAGAIKEALERFKKPVAWFDTDIIVRKDLAPLWVMESNQLKVKYRPDSPTIDCKFNAGIIIFGNSEPVYKMVEYWCDAIKSKNQWMADQEYLYRAYLSYSDRVELVPLRQTEHDIGDRNNPNCFSEKSMLWHAKKNHMENPKFKKEYRYYLEKYNES